MLTEQDNEVITSVGPNTPMGQLMREYWVPALLTSELPEPDGDPLRVLLLGEKFIAFRDTEGRAALVANACPHRRASMFFGRNEESGLRCGYHGWKFDVTGRCVDMPNEPADSDFKNKVRIRSLPVVERGGLVWAYLGNRVDPPPMPAFEYFEDEDAFSVRAFQMECNWLQTIEGDIDTSHFGFLHVGHLSADVAPEGSFLRHILEDRAPRYQVVDAPYGTTYGAYRPAGNTEDDYWRIAHFLFPFYTMTPVGLLGTRKGLTIRMPLDDEHTMVYNVQDKQGRAFSDLAISADTFKGLRIQPNSSDWLGRFRSAATLENDFFIDREAQRSKRSWSGLDGVPLEDRAMTESMDPVVDRSDEHLGSADLMVIRTRRRMLAAVAEHQEHGTVPPGVDEPEVYRQRSGGVLIPRGADWLAATQGLREGRELPTLDPMLSAGV